MDREDIGVLLQRLHCSPTDKMNYFRTLIEGVECNRCIWRLRWQLIDTDGYDILWGHQRYPSNVAHQRDAEMMHVILKMRSQVF
mmetsp:Transcript_15122/g.33777  ORF Transcript_15122/g.33777 Transcript_15122/m.33777 type:complete len:84 (+) Transcript_15122:415-666(+)